ncbi:MAG: DNA-processing protein DprA [Patescibacteria group bacterium]
MDLYIKGKLPKDFVGVAIVGSRNMTARGEKLAYEYAFELAKKGVVIVSGLARGIDTVAHTAALDAGGKTIAVLGSGIDVIYPLQNKDLAERICQNGALISPYPQGTPPSAENFKPRNGIIVDFSAAILIIEGQRQSGTINTANWAADKGREVFVIPGSPATDYLIENGTSIANSPQDIIDYLDGLNNC